MRKIFLIFVSISIFILCISIISGVRLPTVGGDSDQWGGVLNEFLNVSFNESGELRNDTISTNQIINGTITDADISDTMNLTLGDKITFTFGEIIDNLVDGFIKITGNLRVEGIGNFSGTIYINNATDVSTWMYNQTTATFNLYNDTWDESGWVLGEINTTSNIFGLLKGQNLINASELSDTINLDANLNWLGNYNFSINNTDFFVNPGLGRVGIGTTSPTDKLNIDTSTNDVGILLQGANPTGITPTFKIANASGTIFARVGIAGATNNLVAGSASNDLVIRTENRNILFTMDGGASAQMIIQNTSGNVGIGTTSPSSLLHINGSGVVVLRVDGGTQGRFIAIDRGATTDRKIWEFMSDNDNLFIAQINDAETVRTTRLFINGSSGNVGIGTSTPTHKLTVNNGSAAGSGAVDTLKISGGSDLTTANDATGLIFRQWGDSYGGYIRLVNTGTTPGYLNPRLDFGVQSTSTWLPADIGVKMTILGSGNVGIGTTSAGLRLEVEDTALTQVARFQDSDAICDAQPTGSGMTWSCASDEKLKTNITPSTFSALDYVNKIPLFDYTVKKTGEKTTGWVAQEMLKAGYSKLVSNQTDFNSLTNQTETFLAVSMIPQPIIIKSIQELYAENQMLKAELCLKDKTYSWCK